VWHGTLLARVDGDYELDMNSEGALSFLVDGKLVGAGVGSGLDALPELPDLKLPVKVHLTAGDHDLEVRFLTHSYDTRLFVYLKQPGGKRELLAPWALAPIDRVREGAGHMR
jgi:hypothetical protein